MVVTALIMAGGLGERFWPRSRRHLPKQFLSFTGSGKSMLQLTVERILPLVAIDHIFIATGMEYQNLILEQVPEIPLENILCEPVGKNTAPCIGLGAVHIEKRFGEALMLVLASDHMIHYEQKFLETLKEACRIAKEGKNLVTLGIRPGYPDTGYGYIKFRQSENFQAGKQNSCKDARFRDMCEHTNEQSIEKAVDSRELCIQKGTKTFSETSQTSEIRYNSYPVERFVEKPDLDLANKYVTAGDYLWNSGIFVWKVSSILSNMRQLLPEIYHGLNAIQNAIGTSHEQEILEQEFLNFASESIDYGVLEKAEHIYTIPSDFGWDDVGSWLAVGRMKDADENGNVIDGNILTVDAENCILQGGKKLLAIVGAQDLVVVDTEDATLISSKKDTAKIKKLLEQLRQQKREMYL